MSSWSSSSLAASDGNMRKSLLNPSKKKSKQDKMVKKMFGSKNSKSPIGRKFMKSGKDTGKTAPISANNVGPSDEEFDDMLGSSVTNNSNKKKSSTKKKFYG